MTGKALEPRSAQHFMKPGHRAAAAEEEDEADEEEEEEGAVVRCSSADEDEEAEAVGVVSVVQTCFCTSRDITSSAKGTTASL